MNYLAHAYLSFRDPEFLVGNMISDFVKGKKQYQYPPQIQKGIRLHRMIDTYTDGHPAVKAGAAFFKTPYRLYSLAFIDIVFDHFLAVSQNIFPTEKSLAAFVADTYLTLQHYEAHFPFPFDQMFPFMKSQNWLYNYRFTQGIKQSFGGLVRRAVYLNNSAVAFEIFLSKYKELQQFFEDFFPDLNLYAQKCYTQLKQA